MNDLERVRQEKSISLAAKWAPSEVCKVDSKHNAADKISKMLFPATSPLQVLRPLHNWKITVFRIIYPLHPKIV